MHYMVTFPLTTYGYKERVSRFLETGAPPPEGVTVHGRWFTLGHDVGFMHCESEDPKAIYRFVSEWAELVDFEVHPVISDQEAAEVLSSMQG
jgi:hypothetical protein